MLWIYTPHWAPIKYEGEWVEFPDYEHACYTDPAWGRTRTPPTTAASRTAGSGRSAGPAAKDKWPGAYKAIEAFKIDNDEMGDDRRQSISKGKSVEDVVASWMKDNEAPGGPGSASERPRRWAVGRPALPKVKLACRSLWKLFGPGAERLPRGAGPAPPAGGGRRRG